MRTLNLKNLAFVIVLSMALFTFASAQDQDNSGSSGTDMQHMGCGDETTHSDPHMERMGAGQDMADSDTELSPEARMLNNRITIDLKEIDKNEDGKVFVDGMCKDVIKDEPGNCPKCGMKLKEVSIDDAKKDLIKNGFKVK